MDVNRDPETVPASLHDVAAVLIVRHLDDHLPETVVRCLFDSYARIGGEDTVVEQRVRDAERLAQRRLHALATNAGTARSRRMAPQAWRASQERVAL